MSIIGWLFLGLISGYIASRVVSDSGQGLVLNVVLGIVGAIVGAIVGGFILSSFGGAPVTGFNLYSMFVAVVGAILVLLTYHMIAGRRSV